MSRGSIGTFAGAAIGFVIGGPTGAQIGAMIGGAVGSSFDTIPGRKVGEMASPRAQEGEPIPLVFGSARVTGRLMSTGKPDIRKKKESGKGGPKVENETAYLSYSILICESSELRNSTISGILMVMENNKIVYDMRATPAISAADSAKWKQNKIFYFGEEAQAADPTEEMIHGSGNVPAYRGLCRMVVTDEDVTQHGGSVPTYEFVTTQCGAVASTGYFGPTWLALANQTYIGTGLDASNWSAAGAAGVSGFNYVETFENRLLYVSTTAVAYSDDQGATLVFPTLPWSGAPSISRPLKTSSGRIYVLCGTTATAHNFLYYTDDGGATWVTVALGFNAIRITGDTVLFVQTGAATFRVATSGFTFGADITCPIDIQDMGYGGGMLMLGGTNTLSYYWSEDNGATLTAVTVPNPGADPLESYTLFRTESGAWLAMNRIATATTTELIARSPDGKQPFVYVTTPSAQNDGGSQDNFVQAGDQIVAIAKDATGYVQLMGSTTDGTGWALIANTLPVSPKTAAKSVAVIGITGTELPDVPGYYIDTDTGDIGGPSSVAPDCGVTLSQIIDKLDARAGIPVANSVTTALATTDVPGYAIDTFMTVAEAKEPLRRVYFFDCPEYDDAIRYRLRGGATDFTVLPDDLIIGEEATEKGVRGQTVEFPKRLHVQYVDPATGYKPMKQTAERISPDIRVKGEEVASANITIDATTAKRAADIGLKTAWTAREDSREIALPMDYLKAIPSDCYSLDGRRYRITDLRIEAGAIYIQSDYDRISAYSSAAAGVAGPAPAAPPGNIIGPTDFAVMNLPKLRPDDTSTGLYYAARGYTSGWVGSRLQKMRNGAWTTVATIETPSTMGTLRVALGTADTTVSVNMSGTLDSVTAADVTAGANALAVLYPNGTAEILQFQTATEISPGVYDLTVLQRGKLGTVIAAHAAGDKVVLLNNNVRFFQLNPDELDQPSLEFRSIANGLADSAATTYTLTSTVVNPTYVIDGGGA